MKKKPVIGMDFSALVVLVVEDNDFVRMMLRDHLVRFGFGEILEAANGQEGLDKLQRRPDIVICDINMAPLNGFEFLKHLRASSGSTRKIPVIFLTSDAQAESVQQAIDLTVDAYLLKPVTADNLHSKIVTLLTRKLTA